MMIKTILFVESSKEKVMINLFSDMFSEISEPATLCNAANSFGCIGCDGGCKYFCMAYCADDCSAKLEYTDPRLCLDCSHRCGSNCEGSCSKICKSSVMGK